MTNNHTKKSNHPNFFIKIKNMFQKKSHPIKIKINYHAQALKNPKKKKRGNVNAQGKKKSDNWQHDCPKKEKEKEKQKEGQRCCLGKREERKKMQLKLRVFV